MKKGNGEQLPPADADEDSDRLMDDEGDDGSEVEASSVEGQGDEEYRKEVEGILESTSKNLKRGKTMAMKEAIHTAKKAGVSGTKVTAAEKRLDEYKREQKKQEVTAEVEAFFASQAARDIMLCERMVKKATEAECEPDLVQKLQAQLDELVITRPLEDSEVQNARESLITSCREFITEAAFGEGRAVAFQDVERGKKKIDAMLSLDPALMSLVLVKPSDAKDGTFDTMHAPVDNLKAIAASRDKEDLKGLDSVAEDDKAGCVVVRFSMNGTPGAWCFIEPNQGKRDRLVEGLVALAAACTNRNRAGG